MSYYPTLLDIIRKKRSLIPTNKKQMNPPTGIYFRRQDHAISQTDSSSNNNQVNYLSQNQQSKCGPASLPDKYEQCCIRLKMPLLLNSVSNNMINSEPNTVCIVPSTTCDSTGNIRTSDISYTLANNNNASLSCVSATNSVSPQNFNAINVFNGTTTQSKGFRNAIHISHQNSEHIIPSIDESTESYNQNISYCGNTYIQSFNNTNSQRPNICLDQVNTNYVINYPPSNTSASNTKGVQQSRTHENKNSLKPCTKGNNTKRQRTTFNSEQLVTLENLFKANRYLTRPLRAEKAQVLGLKERQIKIWFQNRRMKDKKERQTIKQRIDLLHSPNMNIFVEHKCDTSTSNLSTVFVSETENTPISSWTSSVQRNDDLPELKYMLDNFDWMCEGNNPTSTYKH